MKLWKRTQCLGKVKSVATISCVNQNKNDASPALFLFKGRTIRLEKCNKGGKSKKFAHKGEKIVQKEAKKNTFKISQKIAVQTAEKSYSSLFRDDLIPCLHETFEAGSFVKTKHSASLL